jgi:type I restriction enzyme M protein
MVRLSLVNMYLHGIKEPHISEYDTLTSEDNWNHYSDIILANPPFMSPKGGIRPHKRFSVQSNRSEVLFVDYIAEHLTANGRAAVIVPEGIIFQSGNAYKQLRKMLVEEYLIGVISLPAGVFNPYSGVKTSILWLDKALAKKTEKILFVKIKYDGYDLGAQRRAIKLNDIPNSIHDILEYKKSLTVTESNSQGAFVVPRSTIINNADHCLSSDRYIIKEVRHSDYRVVALGDVVEIIMGQAPPGDACNKDGKGTVFVKVGNFGESFPNEEEWTTKPLKMAYKGDTLVCVVGATIGKINRAIECAIGRSVAAIRPNSAEIDSTFLYYNLVEWTEKLRKKSQGSAIGVITKEMLAEISIALPSLLEQKQIVNELESYQKIIDGARMVVANYRPKVEIDPGWEMVPIDELFTKVSDCVQPQIIDKEVINYIGLENISQGSGEIVGPIKSKPKEIKSTKILFTRGDILYGKLRPNLNKVYYSEIEGICSTDILVLRGKKHVNTRFYSFLLRSDNFNAEVLKGIKGAQLPRVDYQYFCSLLVPKPSEKIQLEMSAKICEEIRMVDCNKNLIKIYEKKIKDRIAKVWGE